MKSTIFFVLALCFNTAAIACGNHPGMTHEQWTSAVRDERSKNGAVKTITDGFFDTRATNSTAEASRNSAPRERSGRRPTAE